MSASLHALARSIEQQPMRLFWAVCAWHLLFWVLAPVLGYRMLPLDTLELLGWGQAWQLGYYKHPPLGPWLGEGFLWLAGERLEALYLLAQLGMLITFGYVYATGRLLLDPLRAALSVALLQGSYFHTYLTPNFNMNSLQLPVWAGLSYHFLRALRDGQRFHWLAFGGFCALAVLSKYSGLLLIGCCGLALLIAAEGRARLRSSGPWLAAALALLLLLPHGLWLLDHWQLPWAYLRGFAREDATLLDHLVEPLRFAGGALAGLLLSALLLLTLGGSEREPPRSSADRWRLALLLFGPLLLSMLYGLLSGSRLKSTWAFPFFSLIGVYWLSRLPLATVRERLPRFLAGLAAVVLLSCSAHLLYKTSLGDSKTRFDGAALGRAAEAFWREHQNGPLRIVIADHIDSAIVSAYAGSRPQMLVDGDFQRSPWLGETDLSAYGALWLCREPRPCPPFGERLRVETSFVIADERFRMGLLAPAGEAGP